MAVDLLLQDTELFAHHDDLVKEGVEGNDLLLFVIIAIVMGRQMSHNAGTHVLGLLVMWSGIVIVFGLDVWTLVRALRR